MYIMDFHRGQMVRVSTNLSTGDALIVWREEKEPGTGSFQERWLGNYLP